MRRFHAPPSAFTHDRVVLGPEESRHLAEVLRVREEQEVRVFDGDGGEFVCTVETVTKKGAVLRVGDRCEPRCPESPLHLTLAPALTKGEKFDLVIQKAVELGVTRLVPLATERCDVKSKDPGKRNERWNRIVIEASKQCGRATLMEIRPVTDLPRFIADPAPGNVNLLFTERAGRSLDDVAASGGITALIGPEGGWSDGELTLAESTGVNLVTLGGRILRAETAAVAITSILQNRFGDLN
jgi:16S rRNA (uracil1498-N3)-methyltransferase